MKTIAFFNNSDGADKTSLVYHLAWMYAELGLSVVAADLDPQAKLTARFLDEDALEGLWPEGLASRTIVGSLRPLLEGEAEILDPHVVDIGGLGLLAGDLALSEFDDEISEQWRLCSEGRARAFRVVGALYTLFARAAVLRSGVDIVLVDVGPNATAINRAALLASDYVVIPLSAGLFSLKGVANLGFRLRTWRAGWRERLLKAPSDLDLPRGEVEPLGYVVMQHAVRLDRPVEAHAKWAARIPAVYQGDVRGEASPEPGVTIDRDPHRLATLEQFRSLMALAEEARKPMFLLRTADGAIGGHAKAVQECYRGFRSVAAEVAKRAGVTLP